jgi:hypothetical protein
MKISLTLEEREELKRLHHPQKDPKQADRIKAILLLDAGYSREEVATILLRDEGTITTWRDSFLVQMSMKLYHCDSPATVALNRITQLGMPISVKIA